MNFTTRSVNFIGRGHDELRSDSIEGPAEMLTFTD